MNTQVSVVIITYNEATNLVRTLSQLYWCDEIIIVDNYSTDATIVICQQYGCKIYYRSFETYVEQKRFAISKATNDWVLSVDAGECLTLERVAELQAELKDIGDYRGFMIPMNLVFRGQEFKYGKENRRYCTRLFSRKWSILIYNNLNESYEAMGPVKQLKSIMQHHTCQNMHQYITTMNNYSSYAAAIHVENGTEKNILLKFAAIPINFISYYFLQRNFLNGMNGFYWSVISTFSDFVKYIKIQDILKDEVTENNTALKSGRFYPKNNHFTFLNPGDPDN